jgi:polyribonucleotide nucleotidyltransferase
MKTIKLKGTEKQFNKLVKLPFITELHTISSFKNKRWLILQWQENSKIVNDIEFMPPERAKIEFTIKGKKNKIDNVIEKSGVLKDMIQLESVVYLKKLIQSQNEIINQKNKEIEKIKQNLFNIDELKEIREMARAEILKTEVNQISKLHDSIYTKAYNLLNQ